MHQVGARYIRVTLRDNCVMGQFYALLSRDFALLLRICDFLLPEAKKGSLTAAKTRAGPNSSQEDGVMVSEWCLKGKCIDILG